MEPGRSRPRRSASTRPYVAGPRATWTLRMSAASATAAGEDTAASRESRAAASRPYAVKSTGAPSSNRRLHATISSPNACARRASSWATAPKPSSPRVRPLSPAALENSFLSHRPARRAATLSGIRRSRARIRPQRQLGDSDRVLARAVRHVDAAGGRAGHVDRVVARSCADDEGEVAPVHHVRDHPRRPHDEDLGPRAAQGFGERLVLERGLEDDLAPGLAEAGDARRLELVGDEHLHLVGSRMAGFIGAPPASGGRPAGPAPRPGPRSRSPR